MGRVARQKISAHTKHLLRGYCLGFSHSLKKGLSDVIGVI